VFGGTFAATNIFLMFARNTWHSNFSRRLFSYTRAVSKKLISLRSYPARQHFR